MRGPILILILFFGIVVKAAAQEKSWLHFLGDSMQVSIDPQLYVDVDEKISPQAIQKFYAQVNIADHKPLIQSLDDYRRQHQLNDWVFYQLIRKTAQLISPKELHYERYTLYKWFLLTKSGFDAHLALEKNRLLFYVRSNDNIYDIPLFMLNGKQYVCLNIHDFDRGSIELEKIYPASQPVPEGQQAFSYKVDRLPEFETAQYNYRDIEFNYGNKTYAYRVQLNSQVETVFKNYPSVDFDYYFNIPLSHKTYTSLIPALKKDVKGMSQRNGVE